MDSMEFDKRLKRLEQRMDRDYKHLERVLLTSQELFHKAFAAMNVSLLEYQLARTKDVKELKEMVHALGASTQNRLEALEKRVERLENPPAA